MHFIVKENFFAFLQRKYTDGKKKAHEEALYVVSHDRDAGPRGAPHPRQPTQVSL